jgi:hypothetical protein
MIARRPLSFLLSALAAGLVVPAGCDDESGGGVAEFVAALPTAETLAIDVPGESDVGLREAPLDHVEAPLLGEPSQLRTLMAATRRYLIELIGNALDAATRMTGERPVLRSDERVIWRQAVPDRSHERALIMRKDGEHFVVSSWLRPLDDAGRPNGPWRFLMTGRITPGADGDSRGTMWVNLTNDRKPRSQGKMTVLWSKIGDTRRLEILIFDGTPDDDAVSRLTRGYLYEDGPDGGMLAFDAGEHDVHLAPDHPLPERVRVLTRWNTARAVRGDYSATGPEVRGDGFRVLIGGECWRPPEAIVTYETRLAVPLDGGEPLRLFERGDRDSCAFPVAEPPIVAPPGDAPIEPPRPEELPDDLPGS